MNIKESARFLKLSYVHGNYAELIEEAEQLRMPYGKFLEDILQQEVETRKKNGVYKRIKNAKFSNKKYLTDYKTDHFSEEVARKIEELKTLDFIRNKENVILIGNPGTGKTHLAVALGIEACFNGMTVLFSSVPDLVLELKEAMSLNQVTMYKRRFDLYDLVILDELGYISFDKEGKEILFNLISSRSGRGSVIITTNLVFDKWQEIFSDPVLTSAIVDRLACKAHVLDMSGDSYRIKETIEWLPNHLKKGNITQKTE